MTTANFEKPAFGLSSSAWLSNYSYEYFKLILMLRDIHINTDSSELK